MIKSKYIFLSYLIFISIFEINAQALKISWQNIYGQTIDTYNPNFLELQNTDLYLTNTFSSSFFHDSLYSFRIAKENIIDRGNKKVKKLINPNSNNSVIGSYLLENGNIVSRVSSYSGGCIVEVKTPTNDLIRNTQFGEGSSCGLRDLISEPNAEFSVIGAKSKISNGVTENDLIFGRFQPEGYLLESIIIGAAENEVVNSFIKTGLDEYVITGYKDITKNSIFTRELWIAKINTKTENFIWQKTYGGDREDFGKKILIDPNGGFYIIGSTNSNNGDVLGFHQNLYGTYADIWVLKVNNIGEIVWKKTIGGDYFDSIEDGIIFENGLLMAGTSGSINGDFANNPNPDINAILIKINSNGSIAWNKSFGGSEQDYFSKLVKSKNGEILFAGVSNSNDKDVSCNVGEYANSVQGNIWIGGFQNENSNSIFLGVPSKTKICPNSTINLNFNFTGLFNSGNQFKLELSDIYGDFDNPVEIQTFNQAGNFNVQFPQNLPPSQFYKIRIKSTSPQVYSFVERRLEIINNIGSVVFNSLLLDEAHNGGPILSGQKVSFSIKTDGFGPFKVKFSNNDSLNIYNNTQREFRTTLSSSGIFKINSFTNACGENSNNYSQFPISIVNNSCTPNFFYSTEISDVKIKKGATEIFANNWPRGGFQNWTDMKYSNKFNENDVLNIEFSGASGFHHAVWLDLNRDNIFSNNEAISSTNSSSSLTQTRTVNYQIPSGIGVGELNIRIILLQGSIVNNPCPTGQYLNGGGLQFQINVVNYSIPELKSLTISGFNPNNSIFLCQTQSYLANFTKSGTFNTSNILKVQLSDSEGSFKNPIDIGQGNNNIISFSIPNNKFGKKIRIVSTDPIVYSNEVSIFTSPVPNIDLGFGNALYNTSENVILIKAKTANFGYNTITFSNGYSYNNSYSPIFSVPNSNLNIDSIKINSTQNSCGTGIVSGIQKVIQFKSNDFIVSLRNGITKAVISSNVNSQIFLNSELIDSLEFVVNLPDNIINYKLDFYGITKSSLIYKNQASNVSNRVVIVPFKKINGICSVFLKLYSDSSSNSFVTQYKSSLEIVEIRNPCSYLTQATYGYQNYFLDSIKIKERFFKQKLDLKTKGQNTYIYSTSYNRIFRGDTIPIFDKNSLFNFSIVGSGLSNPQNFYIYLDADKNGLYSANELLYSSSNKGLLLNDKIIDNFKMPQNIADGKYFFRIRSNGTGFYSGSLNPCGIASETNDILIYIRTPICDSSFASINDISSIKKEVNEYVLLDKKVISSSNALFEAGKFILLSPGFQTEPNVNFKATIEGCGNN
jgi:GEVED domain/Beta-propeller repeat